ncbi:hypothetical protein WQ54_00640 [Bacillus sp. SA1-12]|nr:hypothetical protein WQ54_00640 [Bacillus sp. SA1-12]
MFCCDFCRLNFINNNMNRNFNNFCRPNMVNDFCRCFDPCECVERVEMKQKKRELCDPCEIMEELECVEPVKKKLKKKKVECEPCKKRIR